MHRQPSSIRTSDEYTSIPMVSVKRSPGSRKSTDNNNSDDDELLPLYVSTSSSNSINGGSSKKETSSSRSRFSQKWIHVIPLIVFISLLVLYWFSHPVDVQITDGRIVTVRQTQVPEQIKNNTNGNQIKLLTSKAMQIKVNVTSKAMQIKTNATSKAI
ncbi:hypothetical protein MKW94_030789 [Papaver nudicaule]|uniref:Uncharacterized protein n=1 Tax=Papaver nudicaule TaxID=74823 RepID=A0AA41VME6_PAPNU|nr:hypothetical protein [Papaver nudicaule]